MQSQSRKSTFVISHVFQPLLHIILLLLRAKPHLLLNLIRSSFSLTNEFAIRVLLLPSTRTSLPINYEQFEGEGGEWEDGIGTTGGEV